MDENTELAAASFGERIGAAIIDALIVWGISVFSLVAHDFEIGNGAVILFIGVLSLFYDVILTSAWGRTPGKALLGMHVTMAPGRLENPTLRRSALRYAVKSLEPLVTIVGLIGVAGGLFNLLTLVYTLVILATISSNPLMRGWHDRTAGTWVVKRQIVL